MSLYRLSGGGVIRTSDGALIPADPNNRDYQIYLAWVAAGNTPDAAPIVIPVQTATQAQIVVDVQGVYWVQKADGSNSKQINTTPP